MRDDDTDPACTGHKPPGRKYALVSSKSARARRRTRVVLRVDAATEDQLEAYVHAALVSCAISRRDESRMSDVLTDAEADEWMRRHYDAFIATIEGWGWDTKDRVLLAADGWRVAWGARKDE